MKCRLPAAVFSLVLLPLALPAERINQEGRILGPAPVVTSAVLFNTAEADAIVSAMQIFPVTNAWNEDVSRRPLLPNSEAMIAQIMADLDASRRTLRAFQEMNFVLVPDSQAPVPIEFVEYPDESDPSPYPIPGNLPIETWPSGTGGADPPAMAAGHQQRRRGPSRHHCAARERGPVGDVAGQAGGDELGGVQRGEVRPPEQRAAAGGLDLGRRGRPGDVPRAAALRRVRAGHGRARLPGGGQTHAAAIHLSRDALRLDDAGDADECAGDGPAAAAQVELRHSAHLGQSGEGDPAGLEEVWGIGGRQRQLLLHLGHA